MLSKYSFNFSSNKNDLFSAVSSDIKVAKNYSHGNNKCSYLVNYGIPQVQHFIMLFDKSYNKVEKGGQMDLHIRFWDNSKNSVITRYYNLESW